MTEAPTSLRSKWPIVLCVLVSFVIGYGVSFVSRTPPVLAEPRIQIADFRVAIPEGETTITIMSREPDNPVLGQLTIQRSGDTIAGIPETERRITPRDRLSSEDVAFLRHELGAAVSPNDSLWQKAVKI